MSASTNSFVIDQSFRIPGLGLLVLPCPPAPSWLASLPLHTILVLQLHCPSQLPLPVFATIEEISRAMELPIRTLLFSTDPNGELPLGAWLTLEGVQREDELV
jgi:hypothetical protein